MFAVKCDFDSSFSKKKKTSNDIFANNRSRKAWHTSCQRRIIVLFRSRAFLLKREENEDDIVWKGSRLSKLFVKETILSVFFFGAEQET